jgi:hypothetical protein
MPSYCIYCGSIASCTCYLKLKPKTEGSWVYEMYTPPMKESENIEQLMEDCFCDLSGREGQELAMRRLYSKIQGRVK